MATKKEILAIAKGEQATITRTVKGDKVTCTHSVKASNDDPNRYNLRWTFNFANVSQEEILTLASKAVLIDKQGSWRKADDRMNAEKWQDATFNVRDMLDNRRQALDPTERVTKVAAKMSKAERDELIKKLQSMEG